MTDAKKTTHAIVSKKRLPQSELEVEAEVGIAEMAAYRSRALASLRGAVALPGFRKGHATDEALVARLGEMAVLEDAAELALKDIIPAIARDENIRLIGRPEAAILRLAPGNPLLLKLTFPLFPAFSLPEYKKIAAEKNKEPKRTPAVSDKETDDAIEQIRRDVSAAAGPARQETGAEKKSEPVLPELTLEFVKRLGNFKDVADFRAKVRESLEKEKERREKEKCRGELAEALLKKTNMEAPRLLIENEQEKMLARLEDDLARMGVKFSDYLSRAKKTAEELRAEWKPEAERRAKLEILLGEIAAAEKLEAPAALVQSEAAHLLEHYKDADPGRIRAYVETILLNEQVFEFLEAQK